MKIDLNGQWQLGGQLEHGSAKVENLNAPVPGNIETALFAGGIIADPYIKMNAKELRDYEFFEWEYSRIFKYDGITRRVELVFEGLDCYATIYLNGQNIGSCENALITQKFEATNALRKGVNHLTVKIHSANNMFRKYELDAMAFSAYPFNYESLRVRKPAHAWGWDIAPRMALGGIFRPVYLQAIPPVYFKETSLHLARLENNTASMMFNYHFVTDEAVIKDLAIKVSGVCLDSSFSTQMPAWSTAGVIKFDIRDPALWWPRGYGNANLYGVTVELLKSGKVIAEHKFTTGIRKITLKANEVWTEGEQPDFQFYVNYTPVNIHGCNHVPADALHAGDDKRLPEIIGLAADLNCNMLRLWGGGIYESPVFYDLCDQNGILIWHDFMMGCAVYPQDDEFLKVIEAEATQIVKRLRHHPSIALWAGDNECDSVPFWGLIFDPNRNRITREVLPQVILRHDPTRAFLPSSPWYSPAAIAKGAEIDERFDPTLLTPEQHLWGPRDYFKSDFYRNTRASFTSEIGYHGCPGASSIKKFISSDKLWPYNNNDEWDFHASNPFHGDNDWLNYRTGLMADQVKEMFGKIPDNLEDYALASQICQAEAKKFFIELVRSKPKMTGILWWNLIDCWPQFSDAIVDYYYSKKLAYHYIRRVQQDVVVMVGDANSWHQHVIVANDSNQTVTGHYEVRDSANNEIFSEKDFIIGINGKIVADRVKVCTTAKRLLLISWQLSDGRTGVNHAVCGNPQFDLEVFRNNWLPEIAKLDNTFIAENTGK
ncbi:MAG: hypothetical protein WCI51_13975 [Lentisphaerota bacterium]